jgi:uncharacterized protein YkwD
VTVHRFASKLAAALLAVLPGFLAACDSPAVLSGALPTLKPPTASRLVVLPVCEDADARFAAELLQVVNEERAGRKLVPLAPSPTLSTLADFYACRLIEGGFFSHDDPFDHSTVDSRATDFGYAFLKIGENLAAGQHAPRQCLRDWLASPGHAANLFDPAFTEAGVAVKLGGEHGIYWVLELGRPLSPTVAATP